MKIPIQQPLKESEKVPVETKFPDIIPEFNSYNQTVNGGIFRISGREFPFTVRYGRQYRVVSTEITEGPKLAVTSPYAVDKEEIYETLEMNREWIYDNYLLVEKAGMNSRTEHTLKYEGKTYSYTIKYSKRAKNFRIKILEDNTVKAVVPATVTQEEAEKMVKENAAFIHNTLNNKERKAAERIEFHDGAQLFIKGKEVKIRAVKSHKRIEAGLKKGLLKVTIPHETNDENYHIEREVTEYMRDLTKREVRKYLPKYSKMFKIPVPDTDIRYYKTSWGKCFPAKNLVIFNERLAMIPGELTEYIVAHELCHFHHPNHGKGFYSTLRTVMPDSDEKKQEMKNYRIDMIKRD